MKTKFLILGIIGIGLFVIGFQFLQTDQPKNDLSGLNDYKTKLDIKSLFDIYGVGWNYENNDEGKIWHDVIFELNEGNSEIYQELKYDGTKKTVVVFPTFTAAAYDEPGFYTHYRGECDSKCLTVKIKESYSPRFATSGNGFQVLSLLGYNIISDIEVDQDPNILKKYDKVILLHNEYVTKNEFDAITNHPNVIYLYPNALYAEIKVDYQTNSITLLRGHNYPTPEIINGFDWEYDNSILEYNTDCRDIGFDRVNNGWMLNCYPETAIHQSKVLLKMIKEF